MKEHRLKAQATDRAQYKSSVQNVELPCGFSYLKRPWSRPQGKRAIEEGPDDVTVMPARSGEKPASDT